MLVLWIGNGWRLSVPFLESFLPFAPSFPGPIRAVSKSWEEMRRGNKWVGTYLAKEKIENSRFLFLYPMENTNHPIWDTGP